MMDQVLVKRGAREMRVCAGQERRRDPPLHPSPRVTSLSASPRHVPSAPVRHEGPGVRMWSNHAGCKTRACGRRRRVGAQAEMKGVPVSPTWTCVHVRARRRERVRLHEPSCGCPVRLHEPSCTLRAAACRHAPCGTACGIYRRLRCDPPVHGRGARTGCDPPTCQESCTSLRKALRASARRCQRVAAPPSVPEHVPRRTGA
jgi:hypothetical protein